ncbi:MFS transporter [Mycoplasmatota bacterium zrk1]
MEKVERLWNRNFSIITIGSFISMLGGVAANFAMGLFVYRETDSILMFALFIAINHVPTIILAPIIGPYIDTHSRKKIIVGLDFLFGFLFLGVAYAIYQIGFDIAIYLVISFFISLLGSIYRAAYEGLYPDTITKGKMQKAYSISSLIWPVSQIIVMPIVVSVYDYIGIEGIMIINAISYFIAAMAETLINVKESIKVNSTSSFVTDFKESISYLREEKGIFALNIRSFFTSLTWGAIMSVMLPYFETTPGFGADKYAKLALFMTGARVVTGLLHSTVIKYPVKYKFRISFIIHIVLEIPTFFIFIIPLLGMQILWTIIGALGIITIVIRESAIKSYIPGVIRGRLATIMIVVNSVALISGTLLGGFIAENCGYKYIGFSFGILGLCATITIFTRYGKQMSKVYNVEV